MPKPRPMNSLHHTSRLLLGLALSAATTAALAQAAPPAPPKDAKKFRKAAAPPMEGRVLHIEPGQKRVDPKVLKTAPTARQFAHRQKNAKAAKPGRQLRPAARYPGLAPTVRLESGTPASKPPGTKPPVPRP